MKIKNAAFALLAVSLLTACTTPGDTFSEGQTFTFGDQITISNKEEGSKEKYYNIVKNMDGAMNDFFKADTDEKVLAAFKTSYKSIIIGTHLNSPTDFYMIKWGSTMAYTNGGVKNNREFCDQYGQGNCYINEPFEIHNEYVYYIQQKWLKLDSTISLELTARIVDSYRGGEQSATVSVALSTK